MDSALNNLYKKTSFIARDLNYKQFKIDVLFYFNKENQIIGIVKTMGENKVIIEFDNPQEFSNYCSVFNASF